MCLFNNPKKVTNCVNEFAKETFFSKSLRRYLVMMKEGSSLQTLNYVASMLITPYEHYILIGTKWKD